MASSLADEMLELFNCHPENFKFVQEVNHFLFGLRIFSFFFQRNLIMLLDRTEHLILGVTVHMLKNFTYTELQP